MLGNAVSVAFLRQKKIYRIMNEALQVVAALIWREDKFLICQRPSNKKRALLWEFVGGKVEIGESEENALIRECREELDINIAVDNKYFDVMHHYEDVDVHLTLFNAHILDGKPTMIEHNDMRWISVDEIDNFEFCPADVDILDKIKKDYKIK